MLLLLLVGRPASADEALDTWVSALREEALKEGIGAKTFDAFFADFSLLPNVIRLQNRQPESTQTFAQYLGKVLDKRTRQGRVKLDEHRGLLDEVSRKYGVEKQYIVALWGLESSFGAYTGNTPTVQALATLAYQGRRRPYFRSELIQALRIADEGHVSPDLLQGSWAGAMGQCQFMPSSFKNLAVDHDGDGRRDIWTTKADVFASIANYLKRNGWKKGQLWGRPARLPAGLDSRLIGNRVKMRLSAWRAWDVKKADGSPLPRKPDLWATVVQPDGADTRSFVVYNNYHVFLRWNNSTFFALTAGLLANNLQD